MSETVEIDMSKNILKFQIYTNSKKQIEKVWPSIDIK